MSSTTAKRNTPAPTASISKLSTNRTLRSECTCGNDVDKKGTGGGSEHVHAGRTTAASSASNDNGNLPLDVDASFVHLPPPPPSPSSSSSSRYCGSKTNSNDGNNHDNGSLHSYSYSYGTTPSEMGFRANDDGNSREDGIYNYGLVKAREFVIDLLNETEKAIEMSSSRSREEKCVDVDAADTADTTGAITPADSNADADTDIGTNCSTGRDDASTSFCQECIQMMAAAIDENAERLRFESEAYVDAVKREEDKLKRLKKALSMNQSPNSPPDDDDNTTNTNSEQYAIERTVEAVRQEMEHQQKTHDDYSHELNRLHSLLSEQLQISHSYTMEEHALLSEFNAIRIDARTFEDVQHEMVRRCHAADREIAALENVRLRSVLFDIVVDERGLRYPLINELRFSHRPKGDLRWSEINAAWSQAAQLVMFMGSTMGFTSEDLRIVLLTNCAKIIELDGDGKRKAVHHLGVELEESATQRRRRGVDHIVGSIKAFHALLEQMFVWVRRRRSRVWDVLMEKKENGEGERSPPPFDIGPAFIGSYDFRTLDERDDAAWNGVTHCIASNLKWLSENTHLFSGGS